MLETIIRKFAVFSCRRYGAVLIIAGVLTALALYCVYNLQITSEITDLLPPDSPAVRSFLGATDKYGSTDFLIVILEDNDGEDAEIYLDFADAFAEAILNNKDVQYVDYKIDESIREFYRNTFLDFALLYLEKDDLEKVKEKITDEAISEQVKINREMLRTAVNPAMKRLIVRDPLNFREIFGKHLSSARGGLKISLRDGYYYSADHTLLFMLVKPAKSAQDTVFSKEFLSAVREIETRVRENFPETENLRVGYTGSYAIAVDYVSAIRSDVFFTFLTSFASVLLLFLIAFRKPVMLVVVGIPLLFGVLWTLALAYLYIGHLNVVTSTLCAILFGLGVDYGIHIYNQFSAERTAGAKTDEAIIRALTSIGKGLVTAAMTTALAFYALVPTSFRGLSELGITTGTGILLCLVSMFFVLPALLMLLARRDESAKRHRLQDFGLVRIESRLLKHPRALTIFLLVASGLLLFSALYVEFDDDFRNIRPDEGPAIAEQTNLIEKIGSPLLYTMILVRGDDESEAIKRAAVLANTLGRLREDGVVLSFNSIFAFLPPAEQQEYALRWIERLRQEEPNVFSSERISKTFQTALRREGFQSILPFEDALEGITRALSVSRPISFHDLEEAGLTHLLDRFYSRDGYCEFVFYVYLSEALPRSEAAQTIVDVAGAQPGVEVISAKVLGIELKRIVKKDFVRATVLAVLAVIVVLWFKFRSFLRIALVVSPLAFGVMWMLGVMSILKIPFNLVNVAILPVIIGVGIDNGVYILHHYLTDAKRDLSKTFRLVGRAIIMSSVTTMAGFGSLVFSNYGGLHTVGLLALIGLSACLLSSLIVLPLLLKRLSGSVQKQKI